MGRAKLKIEFIENLKMREKAFKRKKEGLIKKFQELITLCGVDAGMIISIPGQKDLVFPPSDPTQMIRLHRAKNRTKKTQAHHSGCSVGLSGQQSKPPTIPIIPYVEFPPSMNAHKTDDRDNNTQETDPGTSHQFKDHSGCSPMPPIGLSGLMTPYTNVPPLIDYSLRTPHQDFPHYSPIDPHWLMASQHVSMDPPPLMIPYCDVPPQQDFAHYSLMDTQRLLAQP